MRTSTMIRAFLTRKDMEKDFNHHREIHDPEKWHYRFSKITGTNGSRTIIWMVLEPDSSTKLRGLRATVTPDFRLDQELHFDQWTKVRQTIALINEKYKHD